MQGRGSSSLGSLGGPEANVSLCREVAAISHGVLHSVHSLPCAYWQRVWGYKIAANLGLLLISLFITPGSCIPKSLLSWFVFWPVYFSIFNLFCFPFQLEKFLITVSMTESKASVLCSSKHNTFEGQQKICMELLSLVHESFEGTNKHFKLEIYSYKCTSINHSNYLGEEVKYVLSKYIYIT